MCLVVHVQCMCVLIALAFWSYALLADDISLAHGGHSPRGLLIVWRWICSTHTVVLALFVDFRWLVLGEWV